MSTEDGNTPVRDQHLIPRNSVIVPSISHLRLQSYSFVEPERHLLLAVSEEFYIRGKVLRMRQIPPAVFVKLAPEAVSDRTWLTPLAERFWFFELVEDFWFFLRERKAWWMTPIVVVLLLLVVLILGGEKAAVLPFIYTLF